MRITDVLGREVVDTGGRAWGHVHDVHLVQDGPVQGNGQAAFRLHGVVAGRAAIGTRLGYADRRGVEPDRETRGPWPVRALVRWLHRGAVYIPWAAVTSIDEHAVIVDSSVDGFG